MLTEHTRRADANAVVFDETRLSSYLDGDAWVCIFCANRNALGEDRCGNCGLSFRGGRPADTHWSFSTTLHPLAEITIVVVLFLCWRLGDIGAGRRTAGSVHRGRDLWNLERALHLPSERSFQRMALPHPAALHLLDIYYALAHLGGMALVAGWLFWRHRSAYGRWRNAIVATTACCFVIQLVSVAPPRSVPGLGLVDTAHSLGESVYDHGLANQVSSFPSVHFAWAVLVAAMVISAGTTAKRWLVITHPVLTLVAIVVTANHYWLDAFAAATIAAALGWLTRDRPAMRP